MGDSGEGAHRPFAKPFTPGLPSSAKIIVKRNPFPPPDQRALKTLSEQPRVGGNGERSLDFFSGLQGLIPYNYSGHT